MPLLARAQATTALIGNWGKLGLPTTVNAEKKWGCLEKQHCAERSEVILSHADVTCHTQAVALLEAMFLMPSGGASLPTACCRLWAKRKQKHVQVIQVGVVTVQSPST